MAQHDIDLGKVRAIFASGKTQWRAYMNVHAERIALDAPILDIGSGALGTASYQRHIPRYAELGVQSVDLDPARKPTKVANLNEGIPYGDGEFKTCLCFGVLNYLYDVDFVAQEIHRVLQPQGWLYLTIPFLDRVTSDYGDSLRLTAHALEKMLSRNGFTQIEATPYGSGAWGAALDMVEFMLPTRPLRSAAFWLALRLDAFATRRSGGKFRNHNDYPLGYCVAARRD
jgi:SAM-dependent methyltransferase